MQILFEALAAGLQFQNPPDPLRPNFRRLVLGRLDDPLCPLVGRDLNVSRRVLNPPPGFCPWLQVIDLLPKGSHLGFGLCQRRGDLFLGLPALRQGLFECLPVRNRLRSLVFCLLGSRLCLGTGSLFLRQGLFQRLLLRLIFPGDALQIVQDILAVKSTERRAPELPCILVHSASSYQRNRFSPSQNPSAESGELLSSLPLILP